MNRHEKPTGDAQAQGLQDLEFDLQRRLAFLGLDQEDGARLRSLLPGFLSAADKFVEGFYHHLLQFEETSAFLIDQRLIERLKKAQRSHLKSLLTAEWNEEFVEQRRRVGEAHADVGIEPQWFLGAYNLYLQHHLSLLAAESEDVERERFAAVSTLLKAVLLDVGLTLDVYFSRSTMGLRRALDMYWKANTELRQFAQLTSHDLKTPLATAANLCDEAIDEFGDQMPAGARDLIDSARNRMYRMGTTIDELLRSVLKPEGSSADGNASAEEALRQASDRVRSLLNEKGIELRVLDKLPEVSGDQVRLREVFYNLLSNAAKFMDRPSGRITVSAKIVGDRCLITVGDNGPGIPVGELERIFAPFRRLPRHENIEGSGVGLYFAKNLVEQQGGRIWAESPPDGGTRFVMELNLPPDD